MKKLLLVALLTTATLFGGDFVDTQITFSYGDDNIFETSRRSNTARFGELDDELFNENLNTSKSGDETETNLVVYKKFAGFFPGLTIETAFVMEFNIFSNETGESKNVAREKGSYIKVDYALTDKDSLSFTAFPYDSDRFLLGFTYDLSWGGQSFWPKSKINKSSPVPGAKLSYLHRDPEGLSYNFFIGAKTRPYNVNLIEQQDGVDYINNTVATTWAILSGGFVDFKDMVRLDLQGGRFYKGTNPLAGAVELEEDNVLGTRIYADGGSFRLSYRKNFDLEISDQMSVKRNNSDTRNDLAKITEKKDIKADLAVVKPDFGFMFSVEGVYLSEPLRNPDSRNSLQDFNGWAFDVKLKTKFKKFKVNVDFITRNVQFLLFNVPGLTAFEGLSDDLKLTNEYMFSIGGDYKLNKYITIGALFGYKKPASYEAPDSDYKIVIKDREDTSSFTGGLQKNKVKLPNGEDPSDILTAKLGATFHLADGVTFTTEVSWLKDENDTEVVNDVRQFRGSDDTNKFGFALILQSRF